MSIYAIWNNKGGVGKSYLTFQIACEYATQHPEKRVLVVDLCPQANVSSMLLGGIQAGEEALAAIHTTQPRVTVSGYINDRLSSPYRSTNSGASYVMQPHTLNASIPDNVYLVAGDEELELQASGIAYAADAARVPDAWRLTHLWVRELIEDILHSWNTSETAVFIDCNPSFTLYTELAMSAADRLIIPFSSDGSSKRAVKSVLSLVYGIRRHPGDATSTFHTETTRHRMALPKLYMYVGNRLTIMNNTSARAFKTVVGEIDQEIFDVWRNNPSLFQIHPAGAGAPSGIQTFRQMFQYEVRDANTASVVSGALGIPIGSLQAGSVNLAGKRVMVNQRQLDVQVPNIQDLVACIE